MGNHKCKRIIDGKTYNTETATRIEGWDEEYYGITYGLYLYQTRFGAFFEFKFSDGQDEEDYETIIPLSADDARRWLEKHFPQNTDIFEKLFGEMPEAGSGEIKFTLRLPESLRNKLAARAEENKQSLNAWMVRCLERCASPEGEKT
jgi:HicB family